MSRRDPRKALEVRLPNALRRQLVATTNAHLPLGYLARQILRRAIAENPALTDPVSPGTSRPILVQLSVPERAAVETAARHMGATPEVALLTLIFSALQDHG